MSRIIFFLLLCIISVAAKAGCTNIAALHTSRFQINISDNGCGPLEITFTYKEKKNGKLEYRNSGSFPFDEECVLENDKDGDYSGFSCHANGRTPLAGATYKKKQYGFTILNCDMNGRLKLPNYRFVCVSGCTSSSVPKFLHETLTCD